MFQTSSKVLSFENERPLSSGSNINDSGDSLPQAEDKTKRTLIRSGEINEADKASIDVRPEIGNDGIVIF